MISQNYVDLIEQIVKESSVLDLSYTLEENMPAWPTQARYGTVIYESYDFGDAATHSQITMSEHTGTHIDAPLHFVKGAKAVDELELKQLMGRGIFIDASFLKENELLTIDKIKEFEKNNVEIKKGDIVMIRFGWDDKYKLQPNCMEYLNDWPGLSKEGAKYFLDKEVSAVGCDTLSLDAFNVKVNVCHKILLGNDIPIIENLCNLSRLPLVSYIIGLPNKFKNGSGSPIRVIALI